MGGWGGEGEGGEERTRIGTRNQRDVTHKYPEALGWLPSSRTNPSLFTRRICETCEILTSSYASDVVYSNRGGGREGPRTFKLCSWTSARMMHKFAKISDVFDVRQIMSIFFIAIARATCVRVYVCVCVYFWYIRQYVVCVCKGTYINRNLTRDVGKR